MREAREALTTIWPYRLPFNPAQLGRREAVGHRELEDAETKTPSGLRATPEVKRATRALVGTRNFQDISRDTGIAHSMVYAALHGLKVPSVDRFYELARVIKVAPDTLWAHIKRVRMMMDLPLVGVAA